MKRRISAFCCFWILFSLAWGYRAGFAPEPPQADEALTLSTPRRDYLLGEPVVLDLRFRNTSKETKKVMEYIIWPGHYELPVWISRESADFQEFTPNRSFLNIGRTFATLKPSETLQYQYRVLGAPWHDRPLAFPKPGDYRVYVGCVGSASNVVQVRVKQPMGEDAKVWQQLNKESVINLLQEQAIREERKDVPMKMLEIVRTHPNSGYGPALRYTLARIYFLDRRKLPQDDQNLLRRTLGITDVYEFADARLDVMLKERLEPGGEKVLSKVLAAMSKQGVSFDAAPELKARKVIGAETGYSLRDIMYSVTYQQLEANWEQRGDGYFLVPFDATAKPREGGTP